MKTSELSYRVGLGGGEVPPNNRAIGSAGVQSRRRVEHRRGDDSVRRRRGWPYARHGSALHDSVSRGESRWSHSSASERVLIREREVDGETVRNELKSNYRKKLTGGKLLFWRGVIWMVQGLLVENFAFFFIIFFYNLYLRKSVLKK